MMTLMTLMTLMSLMTVMTMLTVMVRMLTTMAMMTFSMIADANPFVTGGMLGTGSNALASPIVAANSRNSICKSWK